MQPFSLPSTLAASLQVKQCIVIDYALISSQDVAKKNTHQQIMISRTGESAARLRLYQ